MKTLIEERKAKILEERFKSFNDKFEEALTRHYHHLDVIVGRLRCTSSTASIAHSEKKRGAFHEKLKHAFLKRRDILNELRNKARPKVTVNRKLSLLCELTNNVCQSLQSRSCDVEESHQKQCIPINYRESLNLNLHLLGGHCY